MTIDTRLTGPGRASQRSDLPAASHPEPLSTSDDPAVADDTQYSIHPFVRKDSEWTAAGGDVSTTPKLENTCKVADLAPFDNSSPLSVSGNNVPLLPNADRRLGYDTTTDTDPAAVNVYQVSGAKWYSRERYAGALLMNLATAFIPALYGTLSIMWVGGLGGAGRVAVAVSYTYAGVVVECFNEGLPRAVWSTTTNRTTLTPSQRHTQIKTLITFQTILAVCIFIAFLAAAPAFVGTFVPQGTDVDLSVKYVRLSSMSLAVSLISTAITLGTRALDHPDVPLAISTITTLLQIFLELAFISTVRVRSASYQPTVLTQAIIRLVCDLSGCAVGFGCFLFILRRAPSSAKPFGTSMRTWLDYTALMQLMRPGKWTFLEISNVVSMGITYATAWGLFNTIRWGLIMVPVIALEATSNAHTGHRWHSVQSVISIRLPTAASDPGSENSPNCVLDNVKRASWRDIRYVVTPAFGSAGLALVFEVPICIALSLGGARGFAWYLVTAGVEGADKGADEVADITGYMWRTVDWMYICYAISTCLATVLLASRAELYLAQSLVSNLCYCLPWAIVIGMNAWRITPDDAWWWHQWVFGGSLVFSLVDITLCVGLWVWLVRTGRMTRWATLSRRVKARGAWLRNE